MGGTMGSLLGRKASVSGLQTSSRITRHSLPSSAPDSHLLEEASVEERNLDDLPDAEIAALFQGATREYVEQQLPARAGVPPQKRSKAIGGQKYELVMLIV
jgi:hypothetical protein